MQYVEGLTDRQAADAVRRCMDWKYALSLDLHDPGFDFTLLHDFRQRLLTNEAAQRLLDTFLTACKASGLIKARGTQRTDSTHVLAAIRTLNRLECVIEAMRLVLNRLASVAPNWVRVTVPNDWYERYGARAENARLPKEATQRQALAEQIGQDGYLLLEYLFNAATPPHLRTLPAVEVLRRIWTQQYYRCTIPDAETLRWRTSDEAPPSALLIHSPYDMEARYSSKRDTTWVGYKVHLSETCDDDRPDLIPHVLTTAATLQDGPKVAKGNISAN
jgi:transposase